MKLITPPELSEHVGRWVCDKLSATYYPGRGQAFGVWDTSLGALRGGVLFEDWNSANIFAHIASDSSRDWPTRSFLRAMFHYPFEHLGVRRVTLPIAASNADALQFAKRLGFRVEATLKDAHPTGDLLLLVLFADDRTDRFGVNHGKSI